MVRSWVMFCDVVRPIFVSRNPVNEKLSLLYTIRDPVEPHVDRFRSLVLDGAICESYGGSVVNLDGSWRLWVPKFLQSLTKWARFSGGFVDRTYFGFHCAAHYVSYNFCEARDDSVGFRRVFWYFAWGGFVAEEKHTAGSTLCFGFREVAGVACCP